MQGRPGCGLASKVGTRDGPDENAVACEEIFVIKSKSHQPESVAGDVKGMEFVLSDWERLAVANELERNCSGLHVNGVDCIVRVQVVGSARLSSECGSATDVICVSVGINHRFDRETLSASQVQVRLQVTGRIDNDRLPRTCHQVAQAASRGPADLINGQVRTFHKGSGRIMLAPGLHSTLEVRAGVPKVAQSLRNELRSVALGANREDGQIRGKLVRKALLNVSDNGVRHLVFAAEFEHLEIGNIDGRYGDASFEPKRVKFITIAYIEDEESVSTFQPFEQVFWSPDFVFQSFYH